ncbi:fumarylacetoacetate hydrolase family protein [Aquirufa sp. ROCK-SH2]
MKIICVGRNYVDHINELSNEKPTSPVVFLKPDTAYLENGKDFYYPKFSNDVHYEVELVVKIAKIGKNIEAKFAHKYIDAIGLGIDFTARDLQAKLKEKGLPWEKAKAFDSSAFVSPLQSFENIEEILSQNISFSLKKNGEMVQDGQSNLMIWKIADLVEDISKYFTLKTGDLIFTGTPAGVGPINIGDQLEGYLMDKKVFELLIK